MKILIVDDTELNRKILAESLGEEYTIIEATSGQEAIQILRERGDEIALIFLDIVMPNGDGFSVLEEMNQQGWIKHIPVIMVSTEGTEENIERALDMGAIDFMPKDSNSALIRKRVNNVMHLFMQQMQMLKMSRQETVRLLYEDMVTGTLNFNGYKHEVERIMRENPQGKFVIWFGDFRNFRFINNTYGYREGDQLLMRWIDEIKNVMSEDELVCHIARDQLVGLIHVAHSMKEIRFNEIRENICAYIKESYPAVKTDIYVGAYMVEAGDWEELDVNAMVERAKVAQETIKGNATGGMAFYNPGHWNRQKRMLEISDHLTEALQNGEIAVWYQPQYDFRTGKMFGAEALCRWNHNTLGGISPAEFIEVLENDGQITLLDQFVWEQACKAAKRWENMGFDLTVSVNISKRDIQQIDLVEHFTNLITKYELSPKQLRLEITESFYIDEKESEVEIVERLQQAGFVVEMDDFGSGYSSLNMLKDVPVDVVKMDLRFLEEIDENSRGANIVRHVIQMVHSLDMEILAEGVESKEQAELLESMDCSYMQGYYFAKPMNQELFEELLY